MVRLVGLSGQTPWSPRGEGWPNCIKKCSNKKGQKSHEEGQKTYIRSVTQINTAEQPGLSFNSSPELLTILSPGAAYKGILRVLPTHLTTHLTSLEHLQRGILSLVSGLGKGGGLTRVKKLDKGHQGGGEVQTQGSKG